MERDFIISILNDAVKRKLEIRLDVKKAYSTYNDTNGQRRSYLTFYTYSTTEIDIPEEHFEGNYHVKRKLSFTNNSDKGKDGAILGVLTIPKKIKDFKFERKGDSMYLEFSGLKISIF